MKKIYWISVVLLLQFAFFNEFVLAQKLPPLSASDSNINAGLVLPKGFVAIKAAENMGRPRHIAVTEDGKLYVKTSKKNFSIYCLIDTDRSGKFDSRLSAGFGKFNGTGIAIKKNYLYASSNSEIFRYSLNEKFEVTNKENPDTIVFGLINKGQHETKSICLDEDGFIYVNIGAYSNSCQEKDRQTGSIGMNPCPILDSAGGIWRFRTDKLNQTYKDGLRYATGLRNVVGLDWNTDLQALFVMQHGRDQLSGNWPQYFTDESSAELPSECMYQLKQGDNAGWPYMYYDHFKGKKMLSPEYGGDGLKEYQGNAIQPSMAFPGHLAPNGLLFYKGKQFPEKYHHGAFIAFHGSWNRAPLPQKGYFVAFVPFQYGKPLGNWEIFADGFAGKTELKSTREAAHRPCGLAQSIDGDLYVSDDYGGVIYKISYRP